MPITPDQSRAARAMLRWSDEDLARAAGIPLARVQRFERGRWILNATRQRLADAFAREGFRFLESGAVLPPRKGG